MSATLAVGLDLVEVERIRTALERTPALAERVFTPSELEYCRRAADPSERLAVRWAAKEAVMKCLGGGVPGVDLRSIEVGHEPDGAPTLSVTGDASDRAAERGISRWLVSLSHTATMAQAVVVALSD